MCTTTLKNSKTFNWVAHLQFRGLVHYHHSGKQHSTQVDMGLKKEQKVLHLNIQATESSLRY